MLVGFLQARLSVSTDVGSVSQRLITPVFLSWGFNRMGVYQFIAGESYRIRMGLSFIIRQALFTTVPSAYLLHAEKWERMREDIPHD